MLIIEHVQKFAHAIICMIKFLSVQQLIRIVAFSLICQLHYFGV